MVQASRVQYRTATDPEESTIINVEPHNESTHATTTFSTDALARTVVAQNPGTTAGFDILSQPDWSKLSLQQLLSQPVPLQQGVQAVGNPIAVSHTSHSSLLTASPFHLEKIRGYMGLRATVVLRLVVNADKFTSGRLVMSYQPSNIYFVERRTDFRHQTQLEHVELDLNTDTEVVLRIPHRGPYSHFDIRNKRYDTGIFRVSEYLQHKGNPYSWSLYMNFEDVDLMGPTATQTVAYQGAYEIEQKNVPLSEKVGKLATAATGLAMVPALTSFMAPLSWAAGVASGVLSAFGYSRPSTTITPTVYIERGVSKLNQTDGTDYADQIAMTTDAHVRVSDQIGLTKNDETSFNYLAGTNSALLRFEFLLLTPVGTKLFSAPLCPYAMKATSDITSALIMHPMAYIANAFHRYRGSISMTMDFAKTIFHSARLLVVFEPIYPEGPSTPPPQVNTIADTINCHKDVVDIRKGTTFSFEFPFISMTPYLPVDRPYGYVHVFVLNALVTETSSVPSNVSVGVKFKANDDMEFACPTDPRFWPYLPQDGTQAVDLTPNLPVTLNNVQYESGLEVGDEPITNKCIGSSSSPTPTVDMAALCIGEKILSMKQLALRSKLFSVNIDATSEPFPRRYNVNPFVVDRFYDNSWLTNPEVEIYYVQIHDWYSYVGSMYEYARGGVTITLHNTTNGASVLAGYKVDSYTPQYDLVDIQPYTEFHMQHIVQSNKTDRMYIPPYDASYVRYTLATPVDAMPNRIQTPNYTSDAGFSQVRYNVQSMNDGIGTTGGLKFWRSAADDSQFGGFKGTPYVILREPYNGDVAPAADQKAELSFRFPNS